jgi:hypothetical protein
MGMTANPLGAHQASELSLARKIGGGGCSKESHLHSVRRMDRGPYRAKLCR